MQAGTPLPFEQDHMAGQPRHEYKQAGCAMYAFSQMVGKQYRKAA